MFLDLGGVGEAGAHALADAGYSTIGDLLADSAEEVAQKTVYSRRSIFGERLFSNLFKRF